MKNSSKYLLKNGALDTRVAPHRYVVASGLLLTLPFIYQLVEALLVRSVGWSYPWDTPPVIYLLLLYVPFIAVFFLIRCSNKLIRIYSWFILAINLWWAVDIVIFLRSGSCC
jgi:hypothetical protein